MKNEYIVPQELKIADRIGNFTLGQWAFIVTGVLTIMFMLISDAVPYWFAMLTAIPIMTLCFYLAFFKKYGMPIYEFVFVFFLFKLDRKSVV